MGRKYKDYIMSNPRDGLNVNKINPSIYISRKRSRCSIFDLHNIAVEIKNIDGRTGYHRVSIMKEVMLANNDRAPNMNSKNEKINGRGY
jgi:hypothetical protein